MDIAERSARRVLGGADIDDVVQLTLLEALRGGGVVGGKIARLRGVAGLWAAAFTLAVGWVVVSLVRTSPAEIQNGAGSTKRTASESEGGGPDSLLLAGIDAAPMRGRVSELGGSTPGQPALRVRVHRADASPVQGATVFGLASSTGESRERVGQTDEGGSLEVPHGVRWIVAETGSHETSLVHAVAARSQDALEMQASRFLDLELMDLGHGIRGSVFGPDGDPAPFARVYSVNTDPRGVVERSRGPFVAQPVLPTVTADAFGRFQIRVLKDIRRLTLTAKGFDFKSMPTTVWTHAEAEQESRSVELHLNVPVDSTERGPALTLLDSTGVALHGGLVFVDPSRHLNHDPRAMGDGFAQGG